MFLHGCYQICTSQFKPLVANSTREKLKLNYFIFNNNIKPRSRVVLLHVSVVSLYRSITEVSLFIVTVSGMYNA